MASWRRPRSSSADGLALAWQIGEQRRAAFCLEGLAAAMASEQPLDAARLLGAAGALREQLGAPLPPSERADYDRVVEATRLAVGPKSFALAWAEGRALSPEQAVEDALARQALSLRILSSQFHITRCDAARSRTMRRMA